MLLQSVVQYIVRFVGQFISTLIIAFVFTIALLRVFVVPYLWTPRLGFIRLWKWIFDPVSEDCVVLESVCAYAEKHGYKCEDFDVQTADGYILLMHHIYPAVLEKENVASRPPVILCHGLMQSSGVFVLDEKEGSLAFFLADQGYDVWLANNRGSGPLRHASMKYWQEEFWNYSIKELACFDFTAIIDFVREKTGYNKVTWIGHSQGNAQAFLALSTSPQLGDKVHMLVALAPAACVSPNCDYVLKMMFNLPSKAFYFLFGKHCFLPVQMAAQKMMNPKIFSIICYSMFSHLFSWGDEKWHDGRKPKYFQYTPRWVSSKGIRHWGRMLAEGQIMMSESDPKTGTQQFSKADLKQVRCPVALFYGDKDKLVDAERLVGELDSSVIRHAEKLEGYEHMDTLWGYDARVRVFEKLVHLIK